MQAVQAVQAFRWQDAVWLHRQAALRCDSLQLPDEAFRSTRLAADLLCERGYYPLAARLLQPVASRFLRPAHPSASLNEDRIRIAAHGISACASYHLKDQGMTLYEWARQLPGPTDAHLELNHALFLHLRYNNAREAELTAACIREMAAQLPVMTPAQQVRYYLDEAFAASDFNQRRTSLLHADTLLNAHSELLSERVYFCFLIGKWLSMSSRAGADPEWPGLRDDPGYYYDTGLQLGQSLGFSETGLESFFFSKGELFEKRNEFEFARLYFQTYLHIQESKQDTSRILLALNRIGTSYYYLDDYDNAILAHKKVIALAQHWTSDPRNALAKLNEARSGIGDCLFAQHQMDSCIQEYTDVLRYYREHGSQRQLITICSNMAMAYASKQQGDSALVLNRETLGYCLDETGTVQAAYQGMYAFSLAQMAHAHVIRQDTDSTLHYLHEAAHFLQNSPGSGNDHVRALQTLGEVWLKLNTPENARHMYAGVIDRSSSGYKRDGSLPDSLGPDISILREAYHALSRISWQVYQQGQGAELPATYQHSRTALHLAANLLRSQIAEHSKMNLSAELQQTSERALICALALHRQTGEAHFLEEAFQVVAGSKSMSLLESMSQEDLILLTAPKDVPVFDANRKRIAKLESELSRLSGRSYSLAMDTLYDLRLQNAEIISLAIQSREDAGLAAPSLDEIRRQVLDDSTALLEYFSGDSTFYRFTLTRSGFSCTTTARDREADTALSTLKQALHGDPNGRVIPAAEYETAAHLLYERLLSGISPQLTPVLRIVPNKVLFNVPFEALVSRRQSDPGALAGYQLHYALDDFRISYAWSTRLLLQSMSTQTSLEPQEILGIAPVFSGEFSGRQLSSAARGMEDLSQAFQRFSLLTGEQATKQNFIQQAEHYGILDFATHSRSNPVNDQERGLLFAADPAETDAEMPTLYPAEVPGLQLNAKLAILGACRSGSGALHAGEGFLSLGRGFAMARCPSLVVGLWDIDDQATVKLVRSFYEGLADSLTKDHALHRAKKLLREKSSEFSHPKYWAGLIQLGDPRPLIILRQPAGYLGVLQSGRKGFWAAGIGGGVLLLLLLYRRRRRRAAA